MALSTGGGLWATGAAGDTAGDGIGPRAELASRSDPLPSSAYLALLPDGEEKRKFILDCTGCHQLDARIAFPAGQPRTREAWQESVRKMLEFGGAHTPFPVISAERRSEPTAVWLAEHLSAPPRPLPPGQAEGAADVREFPYPYGRDLPHDLAVTGTGEVVITGMFTHRMLTLDPATGEYSETPIPVPNANPRSLEIDEQGNWWVLLGQPGKIMRYEPATGQWSSWDIGRYAHEVRYDGRGRAWFNGHFSKDPEVLGYVDVATGSVRTFQVPTHPQAHVTGPVPYGLAVAPDGTIWGSELQGNRIFHFDPQTERFSVYPLPTPYSGPRRIAVDSRGNVWIPEYANNRLARFDPRTEAFTEYELPIRDALPYVAQIDPRSGIVWVGTAAADALVAFDPARERFTVHRLPTTGALIRHISVDPRNGDVWAAYGASPGIAPKIARLSPEGPG